MGSARLLLLLQLLNVSAAIYKQWIPNTNFENVLNWHGNRIPCAQDAVYFERNKNVSVFVQSTHSLKSMHIPWNGEFILAPGAGFAVGTDMQNTECEQGSDITFKEAESYSWMDPDLWHAGLSRDDLENEKHLFSVDEERVPCQYDDVIFQPETSFRVNINSAERTIAVKSISILDKRFDRHEDFAAYLETNTAKMQFHGLGAIKVTNSRCADKTGCVCGNTAEILNICSTLKQHTENQCPGVVCKDPLKPNGHCCEICGATLSLDYSPNFDIEAYRNRLLHGFLNLAKYAGTRMALSKVYRPQTFLRIFPRQGVPEIQIVLIDDKNGSDTGSVAQLLANDIMADVTDNGPSFGILKATMQSATGSNFNNHGGNRAASWSIAVSVIAVLILILLTSVLVLLYRKHNLRFQTWSWPTFWKTDSDLEHISNRTDKGFDNPIFDMETPATQDPQGLYSGEEALKGIQLTESGMFFVNPLYDENDSTA
ncbi:protein amnionless [Pleurodeles waltl]|uniref:protein amnionless n=1 Tax=Pleurodeles waltl TaxID=8319 RepID=UPI00370989E6